MDITRLAIVSVPVSDQDRSLIFYRDILGLEVVLDNEFGPGMRWVQLRTAEPGANFALTLSEDGSAGALRGVIMQVPDAHAAADELRAAGANVVREDYDTPFGHFIEVEDPDGNGLALMEPPPGMEMAAITG
jgi:catechol 2,3-dioxygenase-like lactoylglutathione lyase family enzyme